MHVTVNLADPKPKHLRLSIWDNSWYEILSFTPTSTVPPMHTVALALTINNHY